MTRKQQQYVKSSDTCKVGLARITLVMVFIISLSGRSAAAAIITDDISTNDTATTETATDEDISLVTSLVADATHLQSSATSTTTTTPIPMSVAVQTSSSSTSSNDIALISMPGIEGTAAAAYKDNQLSVSHTSTTGQATTVTTNKPLSTYPELRHRVTHPRPYHFPNKHHHEHHLGPFFEEALNATSGAFHLATEAVLNCRVGMLKDKTVMWVRRTSDKFSLLTVGNITYSGDPRINVKFQYPNNWRLHIKPMQKDDAGLYMCQVSTHPPRVFATNVTVLPRAIRIIDEQGHEVHDRYYKIGSTIDLTCQVAISYIFKSNITSSTVEPNKLLSYSGIYLKPLQHSNSKSGDLIVGTTSSDLNKISNDENFYKKVLWQKDGKRVKLGEASFNISITSGWLISRLSILSAERHHSGIYSCTVANSTAANVDVQILNGETPAAVQHSSGHLAYQFLSILRLLLPLFVSLQQLYISC